MILRLACIRPLFIDVECEMRPSSMQMRPLARLRLQLRPRMMDSQLITFFFSL